MSAKVSLKEKNVLQSVLNHQLDNNKMKTIQPYEMNKIKSDLANFTTNFENDYYSIEPLTANSGSGLMKDHFDVMNKH